MSGEKSREKTQNVGVKDGNTISDEFKSDGGMKEREEEHARFPAHS